MVPAGAITTATDVSHHVFDLCRDDPSLFYSCLFGAFCHRKFRELQNRNGLLEFNKKYTYCARYCKFEAVRLLRQALKKKDYWHSDGAIFNVIILGCHEWEEQPSATPSHKFFKQPSSSLQWIDIYAILSQDPVHLQALFKLIESRGGVETIAFPGLAATVSL